MNKASSDTASKSNVRIGAVATASPPFTVDQQFAEEFLKKHYSDKLSPRSMKLLHTIFKHPSIKQRRFAFENPECLIDESQESRIERFTRWGIELSAQAIMSALAQAGLIIHQVSGLVVNTCTGYVCPGISTYLIERLGLSRNIKSYDLVGSGCGGAIPNLQLCENMIRKDSGSIVLSVSVEICSSTFQISDDLGLLLSNALFADGAAAAVVWDRPQGLTLVSSGSHFAPEHRDTIRYTYKSGQLHNQLSLSLPEIVGKAVKETVTDTLKPQGLRIKDIKHWALHTGGEKIIDSVRDELGLSEKQVSASRLILEEYGNMSSPTVWFALSKLLETSISVGDWCVMAAFGAGLSAHAFLLRA